MNDKPRQILCDLIAQHGVGLCADPRRCENLLRDLCGEHKREIFVLISALKSRVVPELLVPARGMPRTATVGRLIRQLHDELSIAEDAARWAVESWALALGRMTTSIAAVKPRTVLRTAKRLGVPASTGKTDVRRTTQNRLKPGLQTPVHILKGHRNEVLSIAVSPDGQRLLSGGADKTLRLWDLKTGRELRRFDGHRAHVTGVAFTPNGRSALSSSMDRSVRQWDVASGFEQRCFRHDGPVFCLAVSGDGELLLAGGVERVLRLWRLSDGAGLRRIAGHTDTVTCVAFSPDTCRMISGGVDRLLRLWQTTDGQHLQTLRGHDDTIASVAFSPDARHAVSGGFDKTILLWDTNAGKLLGRLDGHTAWVRTVALSPDGRRMLSAAGDLTPARTADNSVRLWDLDARRELHRFESPMTLCVAFAADGRLAVCGAADGAIRVWPLPPP